MKTLRMMRSNNKLIDIETRKFFTSNGEKNVRIIKIQIL